jgi:hypothetical protein
LHRILIIGDAVAPTGFARVIRSIFTPLQKDFELHQLATRHDGAPHDYSWQLYPAAKGKSAQIQLHIRRFVASEFGKALQHRWLIFGKARLSLSIR